MRPSPSYSVLLEYMAQYAYDGLNSACVFVCVEQTTQNYQSKQADDEYLNAQYLTYHIPGSNERFIISLVSNLWPAYAQSVRKDETNVDEKKTLLLSVDGCRM